MKKLLLRMLIMAAPGVAFWWLVQYVVMPLFQTDEVINALGYVFGGVLVLAIWEGVAIRAWVLPFFGRVFSSSVYGGGYSSQDDPLAAMAARIRADKDSALLPDFLTLVEQDKTRARAWSELASLYEETFQNMPEALSALLQGAAHADSAEDRAMFLYRAARFRQQRMNDARGARELYARVVAEYPRTTYGRKAATLVN